MGASTHPQLYSLSRFTHYSELRTLDLSMLIAAKSKLTPERIRANIFYQMRYYLNLLYVRKSHRNNAALIIPFLRAERGTTKRFSNLLENCSRAKLRYIAGQLRYLANRLMKPWNWFRSLYGFQWPSIGVEHSLKQTLFCCFYSDIVGPPMHAHILRY